MMKLMARTDNRSYLNGYKGEGWVHVIECYKHFPFGIGKYILFPDGYKVKVEDCELVYVFDKAG